MKASVSQIAYVVAALLALVMAVGHLIGITASAQVLPWCLFFFILGHFV